MILDALNENQKSAVLTDSKRVLVLAGAGSGKTKTVITKLLHLLNEGVKSTNILAITFTKNAANEMIDRLIISSDETGRYEAFITSKYTKGAEKEQERKKRISEQPWISRLSVKTFHSLCYKILRDHGNPVFDSKFRLITDEKGFENEFDQGLKVGIEKPADIYGSLLISACKDKDYLLKLKRYILDYFVDRIHIETPFESKCHPQKRSYTTLKGDIVKSKSERDIADWLFRHNVKYIYEKPTNLKDFTFKPDFFIPAANLYLEHKSDLSFPTEQKEKQFEEGGKNCVITYESLMNDSNLFNLAMERILKGKVNELITEQVSLNYEEEFKSYHDKIKDFLKMVRRMHSMKKAEDLFVDTLLHEALKSKHERVRHFYELSIPLIKEYERYCTNKSYVDFDDLVILTIKLLKEHKEVRDIYRQQFKYIMVDEFQDVNNLQVKLLDLLLTDFTQLFCVGDDWQSIYGFRGSNVDFIVNFEKHYPESEVHKLEVNYRSNATIVCASNEVIKNNKNQIAKDVRAFRQEPSHIEIHRAKQPGVDDVAFFVEKVRELTNKGFLKEDLLVLYRRSKMADDFFAALKKENLFASFKTIHASKGLEAKAVFILGLSDGSGGFPDVWLDDDIYRVIKNVKFDILMEEERRLFYVAITRAKDMLFLLTTFQNESRFISEIPNAFFQKPVQPTFGSRVCKSCGVQLGTEKKFCGECGAKI